MNKAERLVYNQLVKEGYKVKDIKFNHSKSPDFILNDNRGIEVKKIDKHGFSNFTENQNNLLKDNCEIWFIYKNKIYRKNFFEDIKKSPDYKFYESISLFTYRAINKKYFVIKQLKKVMKKYKIEKLSI